eukprot:3934017-Rhodomonas_salina.1
MPTTHADLCEPIAETHEQSLKRIMNFLQNEAIQEVKAQSLEILRLQANDTKEDLNTASAKFAPRELMLKITFALFILLRSFYKFIPGEITNRVMAKGGFVKMLNNTLSLLHVKNNKDVQWLKVCKRYMAQTHKYFGLDSVFNIPLLQMQPPESTSDEDESDDEKYNHYAALLCHKVSEALWAIDPIMEGVVLNNRKARLDPGAQYDWSQTNMSFYFDTIAIELKTLLSDKNSFTKYMQDAYEQCQEEDEKQMQKTNEMILAFICGSHKTMGSNEGCLIKWLHQDILTKVGQMATKQILQNFNSFNPNVK